MNESQIDLAHMVALGSIGDEDQRAVREIADGDDPALRADFNTEVQLNRQALTLFASASATPPPASLRDRVLDMIAAHESESSAAAQPPCDPVHPAGPTA
jgi:hypothetical protein